MSNGKNPLVLMMALSVPGAAHALGLGDIHVDSALNERLTAEIDIVGATADDLIGLRAAVANRDTFARYGADRPAFLSSATFKVGQDGQGRPVLAIRSTEAFTEPAVNLLVDVRWSTGELVRQYTLLLDPAGFAAPLTVAPLAVASQVAAPTEAVPTAAAPITEATAPAVALTEPTTQQLNPSDAEHAARKTTHIKVGAKATLRGIAWRVGERSESDLQRMMLAIFRANPSAFEGNINRLHLGAVLTIPSSAQVAGISKAEAKREIHAQMTAWRTTARAPARTLVASAGLPATPALQNASTAMPGTAAPGTEIPATESAVSSTHGPIVQADAANSDTADKASDKPATETLNQRIQSLERELTAMNRVLQSENDQMLALQTKADHAAQPAPVANASETSEASETTEASESTESAAVADEPQQQTAARFPVSKAIAGGLGILAAALAAVYFRYRRRAALLRSAALRKPFYVDPSNSDSPADDSLSQTLPNESQHQANYLTRYTTQDNAKERAQQAPVNTPSARPAAGPDDATQPSLPVLSPIQTAGRSEAGGGSFSRNGQDTTVNMSVDTVNLPADPTVSIDPTVRVDPTRLDYNFLDLDMTAQHVQMPSVLNENAVFKERRTNLADVLRLAIEREPDRHDLRIKLLELYYSAAATNRQAFLEVVQKFARERDHVPTDQWEKIAFMGRQIASENPLFAAETTADDDDLADCA